MIKNKVLSKVSFALCLVVNSSNVYADSQPLSLPSGEEWLTHAAQGLAPYWMMESAQGVPVGNFPTFRCDDGSVLKRDSVCPELDRSWISPYFTRDYTRMKSRQIYGYSVLYHLTGDTEALKLAKQGANYLIRHLRDQEHGGFVSYTEQGKPGLAWQQRTSQDQAYALVGLAMLYYLTRDEQLQAVLVEQQRFIFDQYRLSDGQGLAWVLADGDGQSAKQRELVAQLDQINGYLLLVAPLLPEPHKTRWLKDLSWLTEIMVNQYHSKEEQRFYGAIHHKAMMMQEAKHNDFGHTIKAYWMTYLAGEKLNRSDWRAFGKQGMQVTLQRAEYVPYWPDIEAWIPDDLKARWQGHDISTWRGRPDSNGISSWEWAELDQAALTVSMLEGKPKPVLYYTLPSYLQIWVDPKHGGVGLDPQSTKAFHWGNAYHQFEHALVGYVASQALAKQPAILYYAMSAQKADNLNPYYFSGDAVSVESISSNSAAPQIKVTFSNVRP